MGIKYHFALGLPFYNKHHQQQQQQLMSLNNIIENIPEQDVSQCTEYKYYKICKKDRELFFRGTYYINPGTMPQQSKELTLWFEKYQGKKLRKNARIPKEYTERLTIYKNWKKSISPEEFELRSNTVLFEFHLRNRNPIAHFPDLETHRVYYAKQFEKDKCSCKYTHSLKAKWECRTCVGKLSIYSSDENYNRLVKLFENIESVKIEEINEWYIVCNKEYGPTKNTIMSDHDLDDSQLPNDVDSVDLAEDEEVEAVETPVVGTKRTREEAEIELVDLDLLEQESRPSLIATFDPSNFNAQLISALIFAGADQNRKKYKNSKFVDEGEYQNNPFLFI